MVEPRRILITGATGFVGRHLVAALHRDCPAAALFTDHFDVRDHRATLAAVRDAAPDACVHLAGIAAPMQARAEPDLAWSVNLMGTLTLARTILAQAPECRFLFVSSSEVYGASFRPGLPLDETATLAPMNTYAATKAAADLAIGAMVQEGLRAVRVRPFNHTGPGQTDAYVVSAFARQLARMAREPGSATMRVGALHTARDFLDVRDVCAAYVACLTAEDSDLPPGTVLNLASGVPRRIGDVLADLCRIAGQNPRIESDAGLLRPTDIPVAAGDSSLARRLLRWAPAVPWEQTLADVLADWRGRLAD